MIDILKEFEGIFGAVLGGVVTLVATYLLRNAGKVNVEVIEENLEYFSTDAWGQVEHSDQYKAETFKVSFIINLYNSSEIPKPIKNIQLEFLDEHGKTIERVNLKDKDTERRTSHSYISEELHFLNLMPKQLERKELFYVVNLKEYPKFRKVKSCRFIYANENGRRKIIKIN